MDAIKTTPLPRDQIAEFIPTPRGIRAFENVQSDVQNQYEGLATGTFLTLEEDTDLGAERVLTLVSGDLVGVDGGAGDHYTLGLADTAVVAGSYGDATKTVGVSIDGKGRITSAQAYPLITDNVAEGSTNLYYTDARARNALSGGTGIAYDQTGGSIALDLGDSHNVDHAAVSVSAGAGLTGGGDLTATRTLALSPSGVTAGTYSSPASISVDQYGRITAIS